MAQNIVIPDSNFKSYLINNSEINTNQDNEIQLEEAENFTGQINCSNKSISDLTGISKFINITHLKCNENNLKTLDVSKNRELTYLECYSNAITDIILDNPKLTHAIISNNKLIAINLYKCPKLWKFRCDNNLIEDLDFTQNPIINKVYAIKNKLKAFNIANGNNQNKHEINITENPDLTCIQVDSGFYPITLNPKAPHKWFKDETAEYSDNCDGDYIYIPDANLKNCLVNNSNLNTNGDDQIQINEAENYTGAIECSNLDITLSYGTRYFKKTTILNLSNNKLKNINLLNNEALTHLDISANSMSFLPSITSNTELISYNCSNNGGKYTSKIDIDNNGKLEELKIGGNNIFEMDFYKLPLLKVLSCPFNRIEKIDLSKNQNLEYIDISKNTFADDINVANTNNSNIMAFNADISNGPNPRCIQIDKNFTPPTDGSWIYNEDYVFFSDNCKALHNPDFEFTDNTIRIHPIPATTHLTVSSKDVIKNIAIYTVAGERVLKTVNREINVSKLQPGIYLLKILTTKSDALIIKRFVKY